MKTKPGILLVPVDQMRYYAMEPVGNTQTKTPNFAKMAGEGISFTNARSCLKKINYQVF